MTFDLYTFIHVIRFNRYMVECEFIFHNNPPYSSASFNRYMVECECKNQKYVQCLQIVLIDTWWNVNVKASCQQAPGILVLIDTWWNVNSAMSFQDWHCNFVLIDTWWNVNDFDIFRYANLFAVLIDTWWNVNFSKESEV